eukprot:TRINITY_DN64416_c0_g1_i1.p1 TRINITY_DN64416_c0_g1~~TRINITY_DN64416_c0_g1_i1.p1  ORF type:complete len:113 (+),score=5.23 TRINITY_DN64416_c0_g1_i1:117-455(+)
MFCPFCGFQLPGLCKFCTDCGSQLDVEAIQSVLQENSSNKGGSPSHGGSSPSKGRPTHFVANVKDKPHDPETRGHWATSSAVRHARPKGFDSSNQGIIAYRTQWIHKRQQRL